MRKIKIESMYIEESNSTTSENVRVCADICIIDSKTTSSVIYFEFSKEYMKLVDIECADAFLVAILPYALINDYEIIINDKLKISSDLAYQLSELLIPTLKYSKDFGEFHNVPMKFNIIDGCRAGEGGGAGFSRGVDSFYTLLKNKDSIDYLFLFNTQAYGVDGGDIAKKGYCRDLEEAKKCILEYNKMYNKKTKLVAVNTNVHEEFKIRIGYAGTYRDAAIVMLFRKGIGRYYYSTTYTIDNFDIGYCRTYESWILPCLSAAGQKIYSYGGAETKLEKLKYISDYPITYNYLQVCRKAAWEAEKGHTFEQAQTNCTKYCYKCKSTCIALKQIGKLEKYKNRFDIDWICENEREIMEEIKNDAHDRYHSMEFVLNTLIENAAEKDEC